VALITVATNIIAVRPSVPVTNLTEFIGFLKSDVPGKLSYASQGNGILVAHWHLEVFKMQTGTSMVYHIPYRGARVPAIQDVLSGQVQVFIQRAAFIDEPCTSWHSEGIGCHQQDASPRCTQGTHAQTEAGLKGFELEAWVGLFAPARTPAWM
jgi:tripartite-type tricarboxylate transporter receptor subunit TctC